MALSYEYSIGSIRVKEKSLLNKAELEQLLSCHSLDSLCAMLIDKGFGNGKSIGEILADAEARMWEYIRRIAPDFKIFTPFILENDAHNFKVTLKGIMADRNFDRMLITPYTIDVKEIKHSVEKKDFSNLPQWLNKSAETAYDILAHTSDARSSDAVIDKSLMGEIVRAGESSKSEFLKKYFNMYVFYCNIKIAVRGAKAAADRNYLLNALCNVENFRKNAVIDAALKGISPLLDELSSYSEYGCDKAIKQYKLSPSAFEKYTDNLLIGIAKDYCKRTCNGAEPLLGYYLGKKAEIRSIQIIASGIRTNTDTDITRERLRETYG